MEEFSCRTRLISGSGTVNMLGGLGAKRLFLVADPYFVKNGTAERIAQAAGCAQVEIFDKVRPDPTVELAAEGTARLKEFKPDLLAALGGGSAMDLAKAMAYFAKEDCTLAAIPTTSGSGSEVTDFAILTHDKVKHPLVDKRLRPDVAILDSDLLQELPKGLIAESGFDVLAHAAEAYVARESGTMTDLYAREAFSSAYASLPASYAGNRAVRLKVHLSATMAGMAFSQAGLGLCHAMSHSLGGMFHVAHGRLNAILLPSIVSCNAHVAGKKYAELARAAGMGGSADTIAVRNLKNGLLRLRRELNLPETLTQAGIDPRAVWRNVDGIVNAVLADPCSKSNPMVVEGFLVRRILEEVTGRV
ncbi:MAG: iron-containing alcohol dehydrogenase [Oscillospiraceae bacterium]|nr:iron-containing alcohol dehydrogenase [Oscillospiraceae bacterium]